MNYCDAGDAALVTSVARYDEAALAELYRRHAGAVFALARRLTNDQATGEDVVQEVFLRLWRDPERFDPDRGALRPFLLSDTHARAVDRIRSDVARRRREDRDAERVVTTRDDVATAVVDRSTALHVRDALESLPEDERSIIDLAYFGGHSYREAAEVLGIPEGTAKSRIRSGLSRMKGALATSGIGGSWEPA